MRKEEYLRSLEQLLYNIPAEDREEALQFYRDYLEDAGPEAEEEVLRSLGTPQELAESIRRALYGDNAQGDYTRVYRDLPGTERVIFSTGGAFRGGDYGNGTYTGGSYQGSTFGRGHYDNSNASHDSASQSKTHRKGRLSTGQWIFFLILLLCASPVIVSVFATIIGILLSVVGVLIAILVALGIGGIALVIGAIVVIVVALVKMMFSPFSSLLMLGGGLLMIGLGLVGIAIAVWIVSKVLPAIFRGSVNFFSRLLHRS